MTETSPATEATLIERLRSGDETAFEALIDAHSPTLLRVAVGYVRDRAVAEEVVQETWIALLRGIDSFEARSSLKTWLFRVVANIARTRAKSERRSAPFSTIRDDDQNEQLLPAERFLPADHAQFAGHWALGPTAWRTPEERLLDGELRSVIAAAVETLGPSQRTVISLRDIEGWSSEEVCNALELSETNQRVLLHRARTRVRAAIEDHEQATEPTE